SRGDESRLDGFRADRVSRRTRASARDADVTAGALRRPMGRQDAHRRYDELQGPSDGSVALDSIELAEEADRAPRAQRGRKDADLLRRAGRSGLSRQARRVVRQMGI